MRKTADLTISTAITPTRGTIVEAITITIATIDTMIRATPEALSLVVDSNKSSKKSSSLRCQTNIEKITSRKKRSRSSRTNKCKETTCFFKPLEGSNSVIKVGESDVFYFNFKENLYLFSLSYFLEKSFEY